MLRTVVIDFSQECFLIQGQCRKSLTNEHLTYTMQKKKKKKHLLSCFCLLQINMPLLKITAAKVLRLNEEQTCVPEKEEVEKNLQCGHGPDF